MKHSPAGQRLGKAALNGLLIALLLTILGCAAPISASRVGTRQVYKQVEANALSTGKPGADTVVVLHRFGLDELASKRPGEAVSQLHKIALRTDERDLLYALSELSYVAAEHLRHSAIPRDTRDPRDYYLGSAVYAWLFLFGDSKGEVPGAFDRRFRRACDFYNYSLGLALTVAGKTNGSVQLGSGQRRLPVGEINLKFSRVNFPGQLQDYDEILIADQFRVVGMSVRNREPGVGSPLICVRPTNPTFGVRSTSPATVLLRGPGSLSELSALTNSASLELYSASDESTVTIRGLEIPLETDLTTYRAYTLSQSRMWKLGNLGFLAPAERFPSQLLLNQTYEPHRIPVVFVHGTFSSPVTWAEMANSLTADPELRKKYQIWSFVYGSGNPLVRSVADLRSALQAQVQQLDPAGTNKALQQMVVIGHSQGGLLTKSTAVKSEDLIWRVFNNKSIDDLKIDEDQKADLRRLFFLEPLPFVKRVVFIATPHRGSYLSRGIVRGLAHRLVSLPSTLVVRSTEFFKLSAGSEADKFLGGKMPTSLDGMSPGNPGLIAMSRIPVVPEVKAHSIIPVKGKGDPKKGKDGVVAYESAHVEGVTSELIVSAKHTCLNEPAVIEEVRRILREHLKELN